MGEILYSILSYFQACSNSAYSQHSGERYSAIGPLVSHSNDLLRKLTLGYNVYFPLSFTLKLIGYMYISFILITCTETDKRGTHTTTQIEMMSR